MTQEKKLELFEKMLELEHLAATQTYDHHNYTELANGAYTMLEILGIGREYINWAIGK